MDLIDVFEEVYSANDDSDEEEEDSHDKSNSEVSVQYDDVQLDITREQARNNYVRAGAVTCEEEDHISIADNVSLMCKSVDDSLDEVIKEVALSYELSDFQRLSVNVLGSKKSLILISPTGSGKMSVPLLATLVLRKVLNIPNGVCIVTQPLSSIMNEKLENKICRAAVLSMSGVLKTSKTTTADDEKAELSCSLGDLLSGKYPVLFCHGESIDSKLGQFILKEFQKRGMLILVCVDEFHQGGEGHWKSFRPTMMSSSASLRKSNLYGLNLSRLIIFSVLNF